MDIDTSEEDEKSEMLVLRVVSYIAPNFVYSSSLLY